MSVEALIEFWRKPVSMDGSGRYMHEKDRAVLEEWIAGAKPNKPRVTCARNRVFDDPPSGSLHLCLPPMPYVGDLRSAKVIVAMINPTVGHADYTDDDDPEFRRLRDKNIKQQLKSCFALEIPNGSSHRSWSCYYNSMFSSLFVKRSKGEREWIRDKLQKQTAILELVPYYSQNASMLNHKNICLMRDLQSAQHALQAMQELAERSDVFVMCRWRGGLRRWKLDAPHLVDKALATRSRNGLSEEVRRELTAILHF